MSVDKLTQKQELFCNYYVECCGNASEAYRRAYDVSTMQETTITERASRMLKESKISTRLKAIQIELREKSGITKDHILDELEIVLDAKITDYVNFVTQTVTLPQTEPEIKVGVPAQTMEVQTLVFKDFDDLSERQIKAIESVKQGRNGIELKLHGKSWPIEQICKMLGYNAPLNY